MQTLINYSNRYSKYLVVTLLTLVITSCATQPTKDLYVDNHQVTLSTKNNWLIKGKIGFKSQSKKQSANFRWNQNVSDYQLNLTSIIGTSILKMSGNESFATITTDDETYTDTSASSLISRITGWELPIENLKIWVKGQYQLNDEVIISEQGWVTQAIPKCTLCENWIIDYDDYQSVQGVWLPHKITLNNHSSGSQLLIKVNTWSLN
ncbi:lipoprotein insertase outer membrane protein LolB [Paraglaciecola sp. 2405UD69-4]|uniref:lipoprotein insertase outer membrane protein LolB n=1 Tax=Paraglaciecola sp. 2405UD69-4 TaxID=3391836 RepID=UPI0039C93A7E